MVCDTKCSRVILQFPKQGSKAIGLSFRLYIISVIFFLMFVWFYLQNGITDSLNFTTLCLYFVLVLCRVIKSAFTETLVEDEKDFKDQVHI